MQITNFFKDVSQLIEIIDWKEERCDYKEIANVKSGIHIVKARFLRENKDKVKLKSGIYDFYFGFHNCVVKYSCKIFLTVSIDNRVEFDLPEKKKPTGDTAPRHGTPERNLHTVKEDIEHCNISTPISSFKQTFVEATKIQEKRLNLFQFNEKSGCLKNTVSQDTQNRSMDIWEGQLTGENTIVKPCIAGDKSKNFLQDQYLDENNIRIRLHFLSKQLC